MLDLKRHLSRGQQATIDHAMTAAAVVHPLTAVPQVVQIYATRTAAGVSLVTWLGFMALGAIFLSYALLHRIKPMILTQVLWFIVDILVVTGVIIYG